MKTTGAAAGDFAVAAVDRRIPERTTVYLPVSLSGASGGGEGKIEDAVTVNLCRGGAYVACRNRYPVGAPVYLSFSFTSDQAEDAQCEPMLLRAEVVHVAPKNRGEGRKWGMGVRFTRMTSHPLTGGNARLMKGQKA